MQFKKPTRKTVNDVAVTASVVGAASLALAMGTKYFKIQDELFAAKAALVRAYQIIEETKGVDHDILADVVELCDREFLESLLQQVPDYI